MGLNSIHNKVDDFIECHNLTNKTTFYCSIKMVGFEKMQVVQRIDKSKVRCVLIINGYAEVALNDKIEIKGLFDYPLKAISINDSKDNRLFRRRIDSYDFTGSTEVALA